MELMTEKEYADSIKRGNSYQVLSTFDNREEGLKFACEVVQAAMQIDPKLEHLKEDIEEIYEKA